MIFPLLYIWCYYIYNIWYYILPPFSLGISQPIFDDTSQAIGLPKSAEPMKSASRWVVPGARVQCVVRSYGEKTSVVFSVRRWAPVDQLRLGVPGVLTKCRIWYDMIYICNIYIYTYTIVTSSLKKWCLFVESGHHWETCTMGWTETAGAAWVAHPGDRIHSCFVS